MANEKGSRPTLLDIKNYFRKDGDTLSGFRNEWQALTEEDKEQIKSGFENGSMTY